MKTGIDGAQKMLNDKLNPEYTKRRNLAHKEVI